MKTLWETYLNAPFSETRIPWKVYGNQSRKMLTKNYNLKMTDELDELNVIRRTKRNKYWKIIVEERR